MASAFVQILTELAPPRKPMARPALAYHAAVA